ncbi:MAG: restriction endonuclease [Candidatus Electrothrix sp. AUS3]|nr:restriction endonuclease [Candidatus Electrothrix gigas]
MEYSEYTKSKGKVRAWIISLFIKAIRSCSSEEDRINVITWLALIREILANSSLPVATKAKNIYRLTDSKKTVKIMFNSVMEAIKNYKNSDLPFAVKITIPVTLGSACFVGGQGVGIAAFGSAIGMPVLVLIFLGTAGITAVLEAFLSNSEARNYISVILAMLAKDELLRRSKKLQKTIVKDPVKAKSFNMPNDEKELRYKLLKMDPFDFERHIMSFFQNSGLPTIVTKKSNDYGIDGFARHANGYIIVQCKRWASDNPVGRPEIQKWKGVILDEEIKNAIWKTYFVTTSYFTKDAIENAALNNKIILVNMDTIIEWHLKGFSVN